MRATRASAPIKKQSAYCFVVCLCLLSMTACNTDWLAGGVGTGGTGKNPSAGTGTASSAPTVPIPTPTPVQTPDSPILGSAPNSDSSSPTTAIAPLSVNSANYQATQSSESLKVTQNTITTTQLFMFGEPLGLIALSNNALMAFSSINNHTLIHIYQLDTNTITRISEAEIPSKATRISAPTLSEQGDRIYELSTADARYQLTITPNNQLTIRVL